MGQEYKARPLPADQRAILINPRRGLRDQLLILINVKQRQSSPGILDGEADKEAGRDAGSPAIPPERAAQLRSIPTAPQLGMGEFWPHELLPSLLRPKPAAPEQHGCPAHPRARSRWEEAVETQAQRPGSRLGAGEALGMGSGVTAAARGCVGEHSGAMRGHRALEALPACSISRRDSRGCSRDGAEGGAELFALPVTCSLSSGA